MVLDVMLPGLDGLELCARLRAAGDWAPILMLTARRRARTRRDALDTGADDFLAKPFSYVVLVARLRALLRRGSAERPATLPRRRPEPGSRRAPGRRGADSQVELTPRQFSLLEFFLRRAGEVLSKQRDPRARLGLRLRRRPEHRRGLRRPAAAPHRRAVRPGAACRQSRLSATGSTLTGADRAGRTPATCGRCAREDHCGATLVVAARLRRRSGAAVARSKLRCAAARTTLRHGAGRDLAALAAAGRCPTCCHRRGDDGFVQIVTATGRCSRRRRTCRVARPVFAFDGPRRRAGGARRARRPRRRGPRGLPRLCDAARNRRPGRSRSMWRTAWSSCRRRRHAAQHAARRRAGARPPARDGDVGHRRPRAATRRGHPRRGRRDLRRRTSTGGCPFPPGDDEVARLAATMNEMLGRLEDGQRPAARPSPRTPRTSCRAR